MNISFYMPFKPLGHKNPSGDLVTGMELHDFLLKHEHRITLPSTLRSRWLFLQPHRFAGVALERRRVLRSLSASRPDLWLSYHTYYKAPDLLGPSCSRKLGVPYAVFQGIYSTKRKRSLKTLPGFLLNRAALKAADVVFTNKKTDERNLQRLLPQSRIAYVAPGLNPDQFRFDLVSRRGLREQWGLGDRRLVMTTAMLRPGVKTEGVRTVIDSCARLRAAGRNVMLVVVGDGANRSVLEAEAAAKLDGHALFLGKVPRLELYRYYSAADVFAFPGIQESLGMVYLEAQSSGLPVVAYGDWGAREIVRHEQTGLLASAAQFDSFVAAIDRILSDKTTRIAMREAAKTHIRRHHDASVNYLTVLDRLEALVRPAAA